MSATTTPPSPLSLELTRSTLEQPQDASLAEAPTPHPASHIECPVERGLELLGDQYSLQIIHVLLQFEPQRFVELEDQINGISPRTLSARLKHLEAAGLILRKQFATIPPKVEYRLTPAGQALAPLLAELSGWTRTHFPFQPIGPKPSLVGGLV
jgi:DNA-binding HxlR family transcriptional regulator